jgi:hypothetical protein
VQFTVDSKELMGRLGVVEFATSEFQGSKKKDQTNALLKVNKKGIISIESAEEGLSYVKVKMKAQKVDDPGSCLIDVGILRACNLRAKTITFQQTKKKLIGKCGRLKLTINTTGNVSDVEDQIPDKIEAKDYIKLPVKELLEILGLVIYPTIDTELESTLPFIMTTHKGRITASSLDHFCTSLIKPKKSMKLKLEDMKCIPSGILDNILRSTTSKDIEIGFGANQFILNTGDIIVKYPQPQYDIADVYEACESLNQEDLQMQFDFKPEDLCGCIDEVGSIGDTDDAKVELCLEDGKLILKMEGSSGSARSFVKVKNIKGKQKIVAVVFNTLNIFVKHLNDISDETCSFVLRNNIVLIQTKDSSKVYTFPIMSADE